MTSSLGPAEDTRPVAPREIAPARFGPLHEAQFRLFYAGQSISVLGDRITPVALAFAVLDLRGRTSDLGLVLAARIAPFAALLLVAGVVADRVDQRRLMLASDLVRAAAQGATAALLITGQAQLWHLLALQAVYGTAEAFFRPAATSLTPRVVSPARLLQANALVGLSLNVALIIGPPIAAALLSVGSAGSALAVDAASFLVSAALLAPLRPREVERSEPKRFRDDFLGGLHEIRSRPWAAATIGGFAFYHALVLPAIFVLGPAIARRDYDGARSFAGMVTAFGIGAVAGGLVSLRVRPRHPILWCTVLLAVGASQPAIMGLSPNLVVLDGLLLLAGVAISLLFTLWDTTLALEIPPHALARVSSIDYFGATVLMPVGYLLVGPLAHALGLVPALVALSVAGVVISSLSALVPEVRRLDPSAPQPSGSAA